MKDTKAPDREPVDPVVRKLQGDEACRKGDYPSAIEHYLAALSAEPKSAGVWENLAAAYAKDGRHEEAGVCRERIRKLRQSSPVPQAAGTKNPFAAALLSLLPGLGQVYNGQTGTGLMFMAVTWVLFLFFLPLSLVFWLAGIVHAFLTARKINRGGLPFIPLRPAHAVGFLAAFVILYLFLMLITPAVGIWQGESRVIDGAQKINGLPEHPGLAGISTIESARADFVEAEAVLKKFRPFTAENLTRVDAYILIAGLGIRVCDVDSSSIRATDHYQRMNAAMATFDYTTARTEANLAKAEYGNMSRVSGLALQNLSLVDTNTVPADLQQTVSMMKTGFESAKKFQDYVTVMEAFDHFFAFTEYQKKAMAYKPDSTDPVFLKYRQDMKQELQNVITIAGPVENSPVPEASTIAARLVETSRTQLRQMQ